MKLANAVMKIAHCEVLRRLSLEAIWRTKSGGILRGTMDLWKRLTHYIIANMQVSAMISLIVHPTWVVNALEDRITKKIKELV